MKSDLVRIVQCDHAIKRKKKRTRLVECINAVILTMLFIVPGGTALVTNC